MFSAPSSHSVSFHLRSAPLLCHCAFFFLILQELTCTMTVMMMKPVYVCVYVPQWRRVNKLAWFLHFPSERACGAGQPLVISARGLSSLTEAWNYVHVWSPSQTLTGAWLLHPPTIPIPFSWKAIERGVSQRARPKGKGCGVYVVACDGCINTDIRWYMLIKVTKGALLLSLMYRGNGLLDRGLIYTVTFLYKLACVLIIVKERKWTGCSLPWDSMERAKV